jgi:ankyrin repeat protein
MTKRMRDAIWSGNVDTLSAALTEGEDPNAIDERSGWTGLMLAAENDQPRAIEVLLTAGADPRYASEDGWTALHHAVDSECDAQSQGVKPANGRLVSPLVEAGADPDAMWHDTASRGQSPRTMASRYGYEAVLAALRK